MTSGRFPFFKRKPLGAETVGEPVMATPSKADVAPGAVAADLVRDGDAARDRGDWAGALPHYQAALAAAPRLQPIWVQMGHAAKETGRWDLAERAYRTALALAPDDADTNLQLGHILKLRGRPHHALIHYIKASEDAPAAPEAEREVRNLARSLADSPRRLAEFAGYWKQRLRANAPGDLFERGRAITLLVDYSLSRGNLPPSEQRAIDVLQAELDANYVLRNKLEVEWDEAEGGFVIRGPGSRIAVPRFDGGRNGGVVIVTLVSAGSTEPPRDYLAALDALAELPDMRRLTAWLGEPFAPTGGLHAFAGASCGARPWFASAPSVWRRRLNLPASIAALPRYGDRVPRGIVAPGELRVLAAPAGGAGDDGVSVVKGEHARTRHGLALAGEAVTLAIRWPVEFGHRVNVALLGVAASDVCLSVATAASGERETVLAAGRLGWITLRTDADEHGNCEIRIARKPTRDESTGSFLTLYALVVTTGPMDFLFDLARAALAQGEPAMLRTTLARGRLRSARAWLQ